VNKTAESHVYGCGEEGGRDEDPTALDDIRHQPVCLVMCTCSGCVANKLHYVSVSVK
jgi:hypothetical protein